MTEHVDVIVIDTVIVDVRYVHVTVAALKDQSIPGRLLALTRYLNAIIGTMTRGVR